MGDVEDFDVNVLMRSKDLLVQFDSEIVRTGEEIRLAQDMLLIEPACTEVARRQRAHGHLIGTGVKLIEPTRRRAVGVIETKTVGVLKKTQCVVENIVAVEQCQACERETTAIIESREHLG